MTPHTSLPSCCTSSVRVNSGLTLVVHLDGLNGAVVVDYFLHTPQHDTATVGAGRRLYVRKGWQLQPLDSHTLAWQRPILVVFWCLVDGV